MRKTFCLLLLFVLCVTQSPIHGDKPSQKTVTPQSPLSPQASLNQFHLIDDLRIELVVAEPDITSPVAVAFDERGRMWVVEMRDYPNGPKPGDKAGGRIRILEDKDGDGKFESNWIFADEILFGNGVLPWKDGAIVTAAPYIMHLRDTDGDGKADKRKILYQGFAAKNPQLRVSHPNIGIDNWIYVANGLRGGIVKASEPGAKPETPVNIAGKDFRFDLFRDRHEAITGMGQYGLTFDDWGQRFVCDNRHHLRHIVIEDRYLKRNPYLVAPAAVEDISLLEGGPLSSGGKVYPLSKNWTTSSLHEGRFTAACGVYVYRGSLLPKQFQDCAYTCDPTGNLVHREVMKPHGATFRSRPGRKGIEFLASPDDWFRPVFLTEGPDGALYIVDMYRAVIEHPQFMPPELKNRPDLTKGVNRGRIWRIVPKNYKGKFKKPQLADASIAKLVDLLDRPGTWWRLTAQRLLLQRNDREAIEPLKKVVTLSKNPVARAQAAWLLQHFLALNDRVLVKLLNDKHPRVREQAVMLSEQHLRNSPTLQQEVIKLAKDNDARVRFQVALTLGKLDSDKAIKPLRQIALTGASDQWTRLAVASSVPNRSGMLLESMLSAIDRQDLAPTDDRLSLLEEFTSLVGSRRNPEEVEQALNGLRKMQGNNAVRWQSVGVSGLAKGMGRRGTSLGRFLQSLPSVKTATAPDETEILAWFGKLQTKTAAIAVDQKRPADERSLGIELLAHAPWKFARDKILGLMEDANQSIKLAAVRALSEHDDPEVSKLLMRNWRMYTPAVRQAVTEAMFRRTPRLRYFLDQMEAKKVKAGDIDALRRRQLARHRDPKIRTRAAKLLQASTPLGRKVILEQYQAALKLKGDPLSGKRIFKKNCATCHHIGGVGTRVGPDISDTRTKTPSALLHDILNPNGAIDNNYINYMVVTNAGKSMTGIIVADNASSITLQRAQGEKDLILREDIEQIISSGVSLMPEGLEKSIPVKDMADLISFLKNWRYLDGSVPLK